MNYGGEKVVREISQAVGSRWELRTSSDHPEAAQASPAEGVFQASDSIETPLSDTNLHTLPDT